MSERSLSVIVSVWARIAPTAIEKGRMNTRRSAPVITATARERRFQRRACAFIKSGQVATAIVVAQIVAGRKGARIRSESRTRAPMNNTAKTTRVMSGVRGSIMRREWYLSSDRSARARAILPRERREPPLRGVAGGRGLRSRGHLLVDVLPQLRPIPEAARRGVRLVARGGLRRLREHGPRGGGLRPPPRPPRRPPGHEAGGRELPRPRGERVRVARPPHPPPRASLRGVRRGGAGRDRVLGARVLARDLELVRPRARPRPRRRGGQRRPGSDRPPSARAGARAVGGLAPRLPRPGGGGARGGGAHGDRLRAGAGGARAPRAGGGGRGGRRRGAPLARLLDAVRHRVREHDPPERRDRAPLGSPHGPRRRRGPGRRRRLRDGGGEPRGTAPHRLADRPPPGAARLLRLPVPRRARDPRPVPRGVVRDGGRGSGARGLRHGGGGGRRSLSPLPVLRAARALDALRRELDGLRARRRPRPADDGPGLRHRGILRGGPRAARGEPARRGPAHARASPGRPGGGTRGSRAIGLPGPSWVARR